MYVLAFTTRRQFVKSGLRCTKPVNGWPIALTPQMAQTAYKSDAEHAAADGVASEDVPSRIKNTVSNVMKNVQVYATKSPEEQADLVQQTYSEDAEFVDPLMRVKTPREINLAFLSLIKLFKEVKVQQKDIHLNPSPTLPDHLKNASVQQFTVRNTQAYVLERANAISRCLLPAVVDLDVETSLTFSQESGRVLYHQDVWLNNGFRFPHFLKPGNGALSSLVFKIAGWGRQVDNAKFAATHSKY